MSPPLPKYDLLRFLCCVRCFLGKESAFGIRYCELHPGIRLDNSGPHIGISIISGELLSVISDNLSHKDYKRIISGELLPHKDSN